MNDGFETELRSELTRRADEVRTLSDPVGVVRHRVAVGARRRLAAGSAIVVAAMMSAMVVTVPSLVRLGNELAQQRAHEQGLNNPSTTEMRAPDAQDASAVRKKRKWDVLGSLRQDPAYLAKARSWISLAYKGTSEENIRVMFAGDVAGKRLVIGAVEAASKSGAERAAVALSGPGGSTSRLNEHPPVSAYHENGAIISAEIAERNYVTITAPGIDRVEVSPHAVIESNGVPRRSWKKLSGHRVAAGATLSAVGKDAISPRFRAIDGNRVVDDVAMSAVSVAEAPANSSVRLLPSVNMAAGAMPGVRQILLDLQQNVLGPDRITSLTQRFTLVHPAGVCWKVLMVRTKQGASIELVVWSPTAKSTDYQLYLARPVPSTPADSALVWADGCYVNGYLPPTYPGSPTRARVLVDDEKRAEQPITKGMFRLQICDVPGNDPPMAIDRAQVVVELVDKSNDARRVRNLVRSAMAFDALDVPLTDGIAVRS